MQQKITLSIPEPCHENWDNMHPSEQGRFCSSCKKEVVDFTLMTDKELFNYFAKRKRQDVCGRAFSDQLNNPLLKPLEPKKKKLWYLHYFTTLLLFFNKSEIKAQAKVVSTVSPINKPLRLLGSINTLSAANSSELIAGKVTDSSGSPIPFASIRIKGSSKVIVSNDKGIFAIKKVAQPYTIEIIATGFLPIEIVVTDQIFITAILNRVSSKLDLANIVCGGLSFNRESVGYDQRRYFAEIKVSDGANGNPLANAKILIEKNKSGKIKAAHPDANGVYNLRGIKEKDYYSVKISLDGYKEQTIEIEGSNFSKKMQHKKILLERIMSVQPIDSRKKAAASELSLIAVSKPPLSGILGTNKMLKEAVVIADLPYRRTMGTVGSISIRTHYSVTKKMVDTVSGKNIIKTYPNPVAAGSVINVDMKAVTKGEYNLQLINAAGAVIQQDRITVPEPKFIYQLQVKSNIVGGIYFLNVVGPDSRIIYKQKLVIL